MNTTLNARADPRAISAYCQASSLLPSPALGASARMFVISVVPAGLATVLVVGELVGVAPIWLT
jgi:hypothetical protein